MTPERQKGKVYYRCQRRDCPTKCVREETITEAAWRALSRLRITDADLSGFMRAFERWCHSRREETPLKALELRLSQADTRLDRLTDALLDRMIDNEAYLARKEALMLERRRIEEEIKRAGAAADDPLHVRKFLELAKSLADSFISALPEEKRQIVRDAFSNRAVTGKNVALEPADWVVAVQNALTVYFGDPYRPTSRTHPLEQNDQIVALVELSRPGDFESTDFHEDDVHCWEQAA